MSALIEQIRQRDHDRYLCCLLAPRRYQAAALALVAFNSEIAPIAEQVSDATLGAIRLAWWRDALGEIYAGKPPRRHMVVEALADAISRHQLPRESFDRMLQGRELDMDGFVIESKDDWLHYLDSTVLPLHQLLAAISGAACDVEAGSRRYGMIGLLRALPFHAQKGVVRQPLQWLGAHGLTADDVLAGRKPDALRSYTHDVVDFALQLPAVQGPWMIKALDRVAINYAKALKQVDYNIGQCPVRLPSLPLKLTLSSLVSRR